jgi:hypothetical protein
MRSRVISVESRLPSALHRIRVPHNFSRRFARVLLDAGNSNPFVTSSERAAGGPWPEMPAAKKTLRNNHPNFPSMAFEVEYNTGAEPIDRRLTSNHYTITAARRDPTFWSYQSGSYRTRPDWLLPLKPGFSQTNHLGMNSTDYGGGTPVVDVAPRRRPCSRSHRNRRLVSLPVTQADAQSATVAVSTTSSNIRPGDSLRTFKTFAAVHRGDYFQPRPISKRAREASIRFDPAPDSAFGPIWCAWGRRTFTPGQVYGALPIVKKLGFTWVTLDDGWQTSRRLGASTEKSQRRRGHESNGGPLPSGRFSRPTLVGAARSRRAFRRSARPPGYAPA